MDNTELLHARLSKNGRSRNAAWECIREYQSAVSSIALFLVLYHASACNGFSFESYNLPRRDANSELRRASIRRFAQRWSSDTSSSTREDSLFFAQDMANQADATQVVDDVLGATSQEDCEPFYAYSIMESELTTDETDPYQSQYLDPALNSPTDVGAQESYKDSYAQNPNWDSPNGQATTEEMKEVTPNSSPQSISSVDARVLESILQEGKLDLTTEEQVKKLLEGPRDIEDRPHSMGNESGEYSSKFVSVSMVAFVCWFYDSH